MEEMSYFFSFTFTINFLLTYSLTLKQSKINTSKLKEFDFVKKSAFVCKMTSLLSDCVTQIQKDLQSMGNWKKNLAVSFWTLLQSSLFCIYMHEVLQLLITFKDTLIV